MGGAVQREHIDWKRRQVRNKVSLTGTASRPDGRTFRVLVSNVSYEGCHLWTDHDLAIGDTINLTLAGRGELPAQVRWIKDGSIGVRFLTGNSPSDERRARIGV